MVRRSEGNVDRALTPRDSSADVLERSLQRLTIDVFPEAALVRCPRSRRSTCAFDPLCEFDPASVKVSNVTLSGPPLDDCRWQDSASSRSSKTKTRWRKAAAQFPLC